MINETNKKMPRGMLRVLDAIRGFDPSYSFGVAGTGTPVLRCMKEGIMAAEEGRLRLAACLVSVATGYDLALFTSSPNYLALPKHKMAPAL